MSTKNIGEKKKDTRAAQAALVVAAVESIFTSLVVHFPFFKLPILKHTIKFGLQKTMEWLSDKGIVYFNVVWIRLNVSNEVADLEEKRQNAIKGVQNGATEKELDELDKKMLDAFKRLNRYGRGPL
jgi:hypothetical protein